MAKKHQAKNEELDVLDSRYNQKAQDFRDLEKKHDEDIR